MSRYRFRLADGQVFESTNTPAQIHKAHPSAVITHTVEFDAVENPILRPYTDTRAAVAQEEAGPYDGKPVIDLLAIAQERGIDLPKSSKRADVLAALEADDAAKRDGQGEG